MSLAKIHGGYVLSPRVIKDSWIATASPVMREVWTYLCREANYADKKSGGYIVKRGQLFRSYREVRDALGWKVGYRTERYSEDQMKHAMKSLMKQGMITLTSTPHGKLITICNYEYYQNPNNYESINEYHHESTNEPVTNTPVPPNHKQEGKEEEERKKKEEPLKKVPKKVADAQKPFPFKKALLDLGADKQLADDWMLVRKTKNATNTKTALNQFVARVKKSNYTINEALTICIERDWKGFNADWAKKEEPSGQKEPSSLQHYADEVKESARRIMGSRR